MGSGVYKRDGRSRRFIDLTGKAFGTLIAEKQMGKRGGEIVWLCKCSCGNEIITTGMRLRHGHTVTCGTRSNHPPKGGQSQYPEYSSWKSAIYRCTRPDSSHFYLYGGRGIKVCPEWLDDFWAFYKHVGPRPGEDYSLDRINVDGNYEPGNVRWATAKEQTANRRPMPKRINFSEYQRKARMTAIYPAKGEFGGLIYCSLGVQGEAGELSNKIAKVLRDGKGEITAETREGISKEIGDMLWFMSQLCAELDIDFSTIPTDNLDKLAKRFKSGTIQGSGDNR